MAKRSKIVDTAQHMAAWKPSPTASEPTLEVINAMLQRLLLPALLLTSSHADTSATVLEARARSPVFIEIDAQVPLSEDLDFGKS